MHNLLKTKYKIPYMTTSVIITVFTALVMVIATIIFIYLITR
jgi:hypothetical protein